MHNFIPQNLKFKYLIGNIAIFIFLKICKHEGYNKNMQING